MLLYIHIPFCDSKCSYCAFNSYSNIFDRVDEYFKALYKQLEQKLQKNPQIETVFIGGGTPSSVDASYYEPIFSMLQTHTIQEITIEANPNSATKKWQEAIARLGINRISFGVQSFDEEKLRFLQRAHSKKTALQALEIAKKNFEYISMDLLYNCPNDSLELIKRDFDIFLSLNLSHLSAYELIPERGTKFENITVSEDIYSRYIKTEVEAAGLKQYEVSNYGIPSLHNLGYWQYKEYIGVGAGAIGFEKGVRYSNTKDIDAYIQNPFADEKEILQKEDIALEKLFLGLRSCVGFKSEDKKVLNNAQNLLVVDKLIKKSNRYYNRDFFLADEVALYLLK